MNIIFFFFTCAQPYVTAGLFLLLFLRSQNQNQAQLHRSFFFLSCNVRLFSSLLSVMNARSRRRKEQSCVAWLLLFFLFGWSSCAGLQQAVPLTYFDRTEQNRIERIKDNLYLSSEFLFPTPGGKTDRSPFLGKEEKQVRWFLWRAVPLQSDHKHDLIWTVINFLAHHY